MTRVLLVEDDPVIAGIIEYYLNKTGSYEVTRAKNGGEALARARDYFDVILLDILLPDVNGIDLCERLRLWHTCPIIFISCLDSSETIIRALDMGGDDYLVKPFDNRILDARIQANIRRARMDLQVANLNLLQCNDFTLDAARHMVLREDKAFKLSPIEFRILSHFMQNRNQYITPKKLYRLVWGGDCYGDVRTVTVHIHNIRKKIERDPSNPIHLQNVWGKGYIFDPASTD